MPTDFSTVPSCPQFCDVRPGEPDSERVGDDSAFEGVCGIVLAGSHHWGATPFERILRGPMLPVAQQPVIRYSLEWLRAGDVQRAIVCANSSTTEVRAYLGHGAGVGLALDYFEDRLPRGPAGCARDAACRSAAHTFVVTEGALIPSLDLGALLATHWTSRAAATIVVEVDRRRRAVAHDQPPTPGGVYVFDRRALEGVAERGYQDIKQGLLERLYAKGERITMHEVHGLSPRVLDYDSYVSVNRWLIARGHEQERFLPDYRRTPSGLVHPTAVIDDGARVIGPVLISAGARIERDAVVVGPASVGTDSVIRAGALVSRTIIWDRCTVGERAVVDASMLADDTSVRAGDRLFSAVQIASDASGPSVPLPSLEHRDVPLTPDQAPSAVKNGVRIPTGFALPLSGTAALGASGEFRAHS